jgi:hypothetical protein
MFCMLQVWEREMSWSAGQGRHGMPVLVFHRAGQFGTGDGICFFQLLLSIYMHMEREHGDFLSQGRVIHGGALRGVSVRVASWISTRR